MLAMFGALLGKLGYDTAIRSIKIGILIFLAIAWLAIMIPLVTSVLSIFSLLVNTLYEFVDMIFTVQAMDFLVGESREVYSCAMLFFFNIGASEAVQAGLIMTVTTIISILLIQVTLIQISFINFLIDKVKSL
jgi:hypothetical protein